jgi:4-amino-4-deoxy-L-arabinose transferase-like glycosyltransferase
MDNQPPVTYVPAPEQPQVPTPPAKPAGLAITSMVLGILSIVTLFTVILPVPLAIAAIVFGIVSLVKRLGGKGMSIAGIATAGASLLIFLAFILLTALAYTGYSERYNESIIKQEQLQQEKSRIQDGESLFGN